MSCAPRFACRPLRASSPLHGPMITTAAATGNSSSARARTPWALFGFEDMVFLRLAGPGPSEGVVAAMPLRS